jgi:hypothetical protein
MGKYLRTNYRLTGNYIGDTPPKPKAPGAIFYSAEDGRIYIYMSGVSWVYFSAVGTASLNV